jgi:hypothetical protein
MRKLVPILLEIIMGEFRVFFALRKISIMMETSSVCSFEW